LNMLQLPVQRPRSAGPEATVEYPNGTFHCDIARATSLPPPCPAALSKAVSSACPLLTMLVTLLLLLLLLCCFLVSFPFAAAYATSSLCWPRSNHRVSKQQLS
jgi:hypothetical protein